MDNNAWHDFQKESIEKELMETLPILMGVYPVIAKAHFSYYKELMNAGFNSEQALSLVKVHGMMAGIPQNNNENKGE